LKDVVGNGVLVPAGSDLDVVEADVSDLVPDNLIEAPLVDPDGVDPVFVSGSTSKFFRRWQAPRGDQSPSS
jgi:hypothetical protein